MDEFSAFENALIETVPAYPVLYNARYSCLNNAGKEKAWREIAKVTKKTPQQCKRKWKCLRDGYTRYKRQKKMNADSKSKYSDGLLSFLDETILLNKRGSYKTDEVLLCAETESDFHEELSENKSACSELKLKQEPFANDEILQPTKGPQSLTGSDERFEIPVQNMAKSSCRDDEGPVYAFFRSMADVVAQFPPHLIAQTRMKVCNLVSETELQWVSEKSGTNYQGFTGSI